GRMVYFVKRSKTHWERIGPQFDLSPDDVISDDVGTEETIHPVRLGGKLPSLTPDQWRNLKTWEVTATSHCVLRTDGTLHHCIVLAPDPAVAEAVSASLPTWRFAAATVRGRPVPRYVTYQSTFRVRPPPCSQLSSAMERLKCQRAVEQLNPPNQPNR
ncbi:MAG TPA: hypothetical protein VE549_14360, partial [Myxococcaceae bacterium]|nr:hypothetical protein [Myxococcaceae bacterium]